MELIGIGMLSGSRWCTAGCMPANDGMVAASSARVRFDIRMGTELPQWAFKPMCMRRRNRSRALRSGSRSQRERWASVRDRFAKRPGSAVQNPHAVTTGDGTNHHEGHGFGLRNFRSYTRLDPTELIAQERRDLVVGPTGARILRLENDLKCSQSSTSYIPSLKHSFCEHNGQWRFSVSCVESSRSRLWRLRGYGF